MSSSIVDRNREVTTHNNRSHGRQLMVRIVEKLSRLGSLAVDSPLDESFRSIFGETRDLIDLYLQKQAVGDGRQVTCTAGCCDCCFHWVEDVNSFEALLIADYIKMNLPNRVDAICKSCSDSCRELERLEKLVARNLQERNRTVADAPIDPVDLLLNVFYQMRSPCPLLSDDGRCLVYTIRPLTCRIYMSASDPLRCNPDYIHVSVTPTLIVDLSEEANRILDRLHFKFQHFEGDTGLRSQLLKHLSRP